MKKFKTVIKNWLGINEIECNLETAIDSLNTNLSTAAEFSAKNRNKLNDILEDLRKAQAQVSDLEYKLEEKADSYQFDNLEHQLDSLESEIEDCPKQWKVEEMIYEIVQDECMTRSDIEEVVHEANHELILEMVRNEMQEAEQKNFDYDLVVSQVVRIIVEKLNA